MFFLCANVGADLVSLVLGHICCECWLWWLFVSIGGVVVFVLLVLSCFGFNPLLCLVCYFSCAQALAQTWFDCFWVTFVVSVGCGGYLFQLMVWSCLFC